MNSYVIQFERPANRVREGLCEHEIRTVRARAGHSATGAIHGGNFSCQFEAL